MSTIEGGTMKASEALKITNAAIKEKEEKEPYMKDILRIINGTARAGQQGVRVDAFTLEKDQIEALKELGYAVTIRCTYAFISWGEKLKKRGGFYERA